MHGPECHSDSDRITLQRIQITAKGSVYRTAIRQVSAQPWTNESHRTLLSAIISLFLSAALLLFTNGTAHWVPLKQTSHFVRAKRLWPSSTSMPGPASCIAWRTIAIARSLICKFVNTCFTDRDA